MNRLEYREIPDGTSTILTDFTWRCGTCGRGHTAGLPEIYVDARRPSEEQLQIKPARIYGEDGH